MKIERFLSYFVYMYFIYYTCKIIYTFFNMLFVYIFMTCIAYMGSNLRAM